MIHANWSKWGDGETDSGYHIMFVDIDFDKGKILTFGENYSTEAKDYYEEYHNGILDKYKIYSILERRIQYASQIGIIVKHQFDKT